MSDAGSRLPQWLNGRARLVGLQSISDERGSLLPLDFGALPFEPRRIFLVHDVPPGCVRGRHAHRSAHQLLLRVSGRITVEMRAGEERARHELDRSDVGLLLDPGVWASQVYETADARLLVLSSEAYRPDAYLDQGNA